jgi:hypothetical protein
VTGERPTVTLVHLARAANGVEPIRRFVDSYRSVPAGVAHDLRLICKGFTDIAPALNEFERIGREFSVESVSDDGLDVGAYLVSARQISTELVCFLNSYSEVRQEDWLAKLVAAVREPNVGVAGATASFESRLNWQVYRARIHWKNLLSRPLRLYGRAAEFLRTAKQFPRYPNPHVRTNAFAIRTSLFRELRLLGPSRMAALQFESGTDSMTRQILNRGLTPVVVGADGRTFDVRHWPDSATFRHLGQRNLLVHDNQTRLYERAVPRDQVVFGRHAWGKQFRRP